MSKAQQKKNQKVVDESSDEEEEVLTTKKQKNNQGAAKGKPAKHVDSSDEEEVKPKGKTAQKVDNKKKVAESDEEGSEEQPKEEGDFEAFVRGLPFSASKDDVQEYFQECGTILNVNLLMGHDGRSKGIAFVKFSNNAGLQGAIALNGSDFNGRSIFVEKTTPKGSRPAGDRNDRNDRGGARDFPKTERDPNSTSVFVGNLSYNTDEGALTDFFASCGKVANVRIARDQEGNPRGFGHVDFASGDAVDKAVALAGSKIDGRAVRVDFSTPKRNDGGNKGGFGGGRGGSRGGFGGGRGGGRGGFGGGRRY